MEKKLTKSELEILTVLWSRGPSSVREVHELLNSKRPTGYTTVLKLMQIMAEKGLVSRNEDQRAHIYRPAVEEAATQKSLVEDLAERAFGGSAHRLALHALGQRKSSPEELQEIRKLLSRLEEEA
jgi:predicted transcriptional regulator